MLAGQKAATVGKITKPRSEYERALLLMKSRHLHDARWRGDQVEIPRDTMLQIKRSCLQRVEIELDEIDKLSVIHVAGTKGKGSTCSYVESILRHYGYKTGLFSSPHLVDYRERIRINGQLVDKDVFTEAFWHVYEKLLLTGAANDGKMLSQFRIVLTVALYIFLRVEKVDVLILEVGIGGQYDATNIVQRPVVCGITSLHLDHQEQLGNTMSEIAWHKSGIFKKGVPAVTVPQCAQSIMEVLVQRASDTGCPLYLASPLNMSKLPEGLSLGIAGDKQTYNAALAVQLARFWLHAKGNGGDNGCQRIEMSAFGNQPNAADMVSIPVLSIPSLSAEMIAGLTKCRLDGRAQTIKRSGVTYYIDGAHTRGSMEECAKWFHEEAAKEESNIRGQVARALVFHMKKPRLAAPHLEYLKDLGFRLAAFVPNVISTSARERFLDLLNANYIEAEAAKQTVEHMNDWQAILSSAAPCTTSLCNGDHPTRPLCVSASFPSVVSGLWWVSLCRDSSLEAMATADLQMLKESSEDVRVADVDGVKDAVHVQVLVTGSILMVGSALSVLQPGA